MFSQISGPDSLPVRVTSGPLRLVLQLNPDRATARRRPAAMTTMRQPFNENAFNFLKIRPAETLAKMVYEDDADSREKENLLIINVSPLEYGHSLFVPDVFAQWTQVEASMMTAIPIILKRFELACPR